MKKYRIKILYAIICVLLLFAKGAEIYAVAVSNPTKIEAPDSGNQTPTPETAAPMENKPTPSRAFTNTRFAINEATAKAVEQGKYKKKQTPPPGKDAKNKPKNGKFSSYEELVEFVYNNIEKDLSATERKEINNYMKVKVSQGEKDLTLKLINAEYIESNPIAANRGILSVQQAIGNAISFYNKGGKIIPASEVESLDINSSQSMAVGEIYAPDKDNSANQGEYIVVDPPEDLESALAGLVEALGDGVNWIAQACDASLDRLVFGRLIHYGTNYYCFELVKGNPYGIVGSYVYKLFRNVAIPFVLLMVLMRFAKAAWNSGSGEQRRVFKDSIGRCVVVLLLLFLMPNIIDLLIYIKDVIMHYISVKMSSDISGLYGMDPENDATIIGYYKQASKGHLLDASLYLGVSFITIFYMITYISTAIAMLVNFIFFPLLSIFSFSDNKLLDTWFKQCVGNIFVPLLDSVLLLLPLMLNNLIGDNSVKAYLITFIATFTVIPSRSIIRNMLGVGGGGMSEMLGLGALMGTMKMLGGLKRRVGNGIDGLKELNNVRKENNELANMYGDLARANGEGGQLTGRFAKLGKGAKQLKSIDDERDKKENGLGGMQGKEDEKTNEERDREKLTNPKGEDGANNQHLNSVEKDEENEGHGINAPNTGEENKPLDSVGENGENEETINGIGNPEEGKTLNSVTNEGDSEGTGTGSLSPEEQQVVDKHNNLKQQAIDKNNILKGYANVDNFQNKEFANAFNFAERAKLHKQKANRARTHMITNAIGGTIGGAAVGAIGATVASSATMFTGPHINMTAASGGANLGSYVGSKAGSYVNEKIANVAMSDTVRRVASPIKHKGLSMAAGAAGSVADTVRPDSSTAQRLNTYSEAQKQIANSGYDGYYSYNANFDESQTSPNPSNLSNYGSYSPDAAERELERVRRQMEFEQRRMHQEERLQPESQPVYDMLPDVSNISEVYDALGLDYEAVEEIDSLINALVYQEGDNYKEIQKEFNNMQANYEKENPDIDKNSSDYEDKSLSHEATAIRTIFYRNQNIPDIYKKHQASAKQQEEYGKKIFTEIRKKLNEEKNIASKNKKK